MARLSPDPFRTPASTTLRFGTLILLAASATASWYWLFSTIWHPPDGAVLQPRCMVRTGYYTPMGVWLSPADQARYDQYNRCIRHSATPHSALWVVSSLGLLALVTLLLFALQPGWLRRRKGLVPLETLPLPDSAALRDELRALVGIAGLDWAPRFLIDPANPRPAGRAFGGLGPRQVALSAGLVVQLRHAPHKFRAVVLHELAHIRNGDVTITYVTIAVWRAFALVTVLPALTNLVDPALVTAQPLRNPYRVGWTLVFRQLGNLGWFFLVLTALVYLSRTAVLRAREGYADARAAQWLGTGALREVLAASAEPDGTRWWHTHPRRWARVRLLDQPELLLRPGFWENFTAGFAIQICDTYALAAMVSTWDPSSGSFTDQSPHDATTLLTALVVVIAGWRGAAFIHSGAGRRGAYTRAALGLGLGLTAAYGLVMLRDDALLTPTLADTPTWADLQWELLLVALVLVGVLVLCHWAGHCAQTVGTVSRTPRGLAAIALAVAGTWACLRWWSILYYGMPSLTATLASDASMWRQSVLQAHWTALDPAVVKAVLYPFILLWVIGPVAIFVAPLLWLVPLLLGAARREAVRSATRTGTLAALAWLLVDLGLHTLAHLTVPSGVRAGGGFALVFICWEIAAVLAVQTGTAVLLGVRRMRLMPSLFATTLTGLLCCLALWATHLTSACLPGGQFSAGRCSSHGDVFVAFDALRDVGVLGSLVTVGGVLLGRALRRLYRPRPAAVPRPVPGRPPGTATRLALAALAVAFIALAVSSPPKHEQVDSIGVDYVPPHLDPVQVAWESYPLWLQGGGMAHANAIDTAYLEMVRAIEPLINRRLSWVGISQDPHVRIGCRSLATAVGAVGTFPMPPGQETAAHWAAYLQMLDHITDDCTTATTSQDPDTEATEMKAALFIPGAPAAAVGADIQAAVKMVAG